MDREVNNPGRPEVAWPADFYGNIDNRPLNPRLILARMLSGQGVSINLVAVDIWGSALPSCVAVHASDEGKRIISEMEGTPELRSLLTAGPSSPSAKLVDSLPWDEATKTRVKALILQRGADHQPVGDSFRRQWTQEAEEMLGSSGLEPFTPADIRGLLEPILARILAETSA